MACELLTRALQPVAVSRILTRFRLIMAQPNHESPALTVVAQTNWLALADIKRRNEIVLTRQPEHLSLLATGLEALELVSLGGVTA